MCFVTKTLTGGKQGQAWVFQLHEPYNFYNAPFRLIYGERRVLVVVNNVYVDQFRIFNISTILVDY